MKNKALGMAVVLVCFSFIPRMIGAEEGVPPDEGPIVINGEGEEPLSIEALDPKVDTLYQSFLRLPNTLEKDLQKFNEYTYSIGYLTTWNPEGMKKAGEAWWSVYRRKCETHDIERNYLDKMKEKLEKDKLEAKRFDPEMIYQRESVNGNEDN